MQDGLYWGVRGDKGGCCLSYPWVYQNRCCWSSDDRISNPCLCALLTDWSHHRPVYWTTDFASFTSTRVSHFMIIITLIQSRERNLHTFRTIICTVLQGLDDIRNASFRSICWRWYHAHYWYEVGHISERNVCSAIKLLWNNLIWVQTGK